jgi:septum site-determining protein MinD
VSAIRDADRIIGLLEANELRDSRLIVNRLRADMVKRGDMMSIDDVVEILAIDLIGAIPDDENIVISTNNGEPIVSNQQLVSGKTYMNICKRILGEEVPYIDFQVPGGFFSKIKNIIGFSS